MGEQKQSGRAREGASETEFTQPPPCVTAAMVVMSVDTVVTAKEPMFSACRWRAALAGRSWTRKQ